ncbi:hypothetical protein PHYBLDRAFT_74175 [Phycomyces blakesleeanus NRRL 1555(-)]|uniref:Uncharacterized protein n=1 Tax=Phycomyces blakesleeanus (strain ATCC 8743b / DSM 1359 / FGSC 10004 / NBRC 33097 / NRRL 1555) TaxID=763407 RepID=A0A167NCZ7_PHYB8|nr:hypothetical protein PHYBLDRAFT_74175 [Phycomyces blakesleeanus NRRL 1555(-)]OAD75704.1 hypothetical protein PHYBLDRAFT_74175 [Phycomyces blakesleeanus NRRL 1555(-)]|eukprot:XP_018293744.1 hypothetical protein PHYBLDRAFT_74175 [Phycomyces blakesleeanus NRRL 1555(-)]
MKNLRSDKSTWNAVKQQMASRSRTKKIVQWKLMQFIWRHKHAGNIWIGLLQTLARVSVVRQITDNNISLEQQLLLDLGPDYETYFTENKSSFSENKNDISSDSNNTRDSTNDSDFIL